MDKIQAIGNKLWTTKSGQKIRIKDLEPAHLDNIIGLLQRKVNSLKCITDDFPSFDGDMAQILAEKEWMNAVNYVNILEKTIKDLKLYHNFKNPKKQ